MKRKNTKTSVLLTFKILMALLLSFPLSSISQVTDTISNWDGIEQDWHFVGNGHEVIENPYPWGINVSEHCLEFITSEGEYDFMYWDMDEPVSFDEWPLYSMKIYAPPQGGSVTCKFENSTNTVFQEIVMTPVPGQWYELEYNFGGLYYENFVRMVIFFDFQGTTPNEHWLIDDIIRKEGEPLEIESHLPLFVINTYGVPIPDEPKIDAYMGIIDNGPGNINHLTDPFNGYDGFIGIETRGQSTQMFPKKSYAFETRDEEGGNLDVSLLGMPEENDWILYAPYTDKSMLRNMVTFAMGNRMSGYCTRTAFCEVVLNNNYQGVYILEEKIKKNENRVDIATLKPDEISGDDVTGGYILKVDKLDPDFQLGTDGWKSNPVPPYPNAMDIIFQYYYPDPDDIVPEQKQYIKDWITIAENTLTSTGFANPDNGYHKYFDLVSFIDFMFISEITKEVDKYRYSNYFYKEKDSDGGKFFAGPHWDYNLGYGNVDYWQPGIETWGWVYPQITPDEWSRMFWWKRLNEDPYFRNLAKTRWQYLRQDAISDEFITSTIDSAINLLGEAIDRNYERWPILGQYVWPNYNWYGNDYSDEVAYFENFFFDRLEWMDANMPGTILQPWVAITAEGNIIHVKISGDFFNNRNPQPNHFQLNDAPPSIFIANADWVDATECLLQLSGNPLSYPDISVTVKEEIINTFTDLVSNKLETQLIVGPGQELPFVKVFNSGQQLHIQCTTPDLLKGEVRIFDLAGRNVGNYSLNQASETIISHDLMAGIYFISLVNDQNRPTFKVIILN
jgi:hypothetical protein